MVGDINLKWDEPKEVMVPILRRHSVDELRDTVP